MVRKQKPQRKYWVYVRVNENNWAVSGRAEVEKIVIAKGKAGQYPGTPPLLSKHLDYYFIGQSRLITNLIRE